jgi:hypothetical protein
MFEQATGKEEKDRSRAIMILSGLAVVVVIVLIVLVTSLSRREAPVVLSRAGTPEFDSYVQLVTFNNISKFHGERLNNRYGRITCVVENQGDRTIEGLEVRAYALGLDNQIHKERIIKVVPNGTNEELGPSQTVRIEVFLEPIPDPSTIQDMKLEVFSLKLK